MASVTLVSMSPSPTNSALKHQVEFRIRNFEGEFRWVTSRAVAIRMPDGSISEWIGTLTDIHEQRTAEIALRE